MRLVIPPLKIEESDAFTKDVLDRESYGKALLNIVTRSNDALVISLDGQWGEGKTTFIKMWQGLLVEESIPNIYIDAFTNDYVDDAFVLVASAITAYAEKNIIKGYDERVNELREKMKKVGGQLLSWSVRLGIKAATAGIIKDADMEELKEIKGDLSKSLSDVAGRFVDERIRSHSESVALIQSFRELLSSLPSKLLKDGDKPLVIIIDELDRCRPTFAVQMIEKIKHLFSVEKIVFVLVLNKEQLEESIRSVYGQNIDAHIYLQKFITLETKLPKRKGNQLENDLSKYAQRLLELHEMETWSDDKLIINCVEPFANHFNLSLRQLEKVFSYLAVFYGTSDENHLRVVPIIVFLAMVKVVSPRIFDQLLSQNISYDEVVSELKLNGLTEGDEQHWLVLWIRYYLLNNEEFNSLPQDDPVRDYSLSLLQYNLSREKLIPFFAQKLSMFVVL